MNTPKYDYTRLAIPTDIQLMNGVYVLTDGEHYYIGKCDDKDRGFRQRYGTYVSNEGREVAKTSGDRFFQESDNVRMHWLYCCNPQEVTTIKDVESYFMKAYRILHGDKLVNERKKDSYEVSYNDVKHYFGHDLEYKINGSLMLKHGLLVPAHQ